MRDCGRTERGKKIRGWGRKEGKKGIEVTRTREGYETSLFQFSCIPSSKAIEEVNTLKAQWNHNIKVSVITDSRDVWNTFTNLSCVDTFQKQAQMLSQIKPLFKCKNKSKSADQACLRGREFCIDWVPQWKRQ